MTTRLRASNFSLKHTLECGQFFRFTKAMETYLVQSSDPIFSLSQKGEFLFYDGVEEDFLIHFLRLDEDLDSVYQTIDRDPVIHRAIREYRGMRILRQDPWECLLSFLCSSAKRISHIRSMTEALCRSFGKKIVFENYTGYGFPEPGCIENSFHLEQVKAGFRAEYLLNANRCMDRTRLLSLKALPYKEARVQLMELSGVGKKVADCTLLYSLDFLEAFPMDIWIKRGIQLNYFKGRKTGEKAMEEFVSGHFGPYAGYAQLYLFHYWRNRPRSSQI